MTRTVSHTEKFRIDQAAEILFPLFSAEGEKLWAPGWDYVNISGSKDMHEDFIFLTHGHDHSSQDTIWLVKSFLPDEYYVQFYRVEPGEKVGLVTVQCFEVNTGVSDVEVTYQYTPLSDKGERFLKQFTAEHYRKFIAGWETHLNDYFDSI
jgi:hypothetical protein